MVVDCHVHLRDEEQEHKETIEHGLLVARDSGVSSVFDMPNTKRPVTTRERVEARLALADKADVEEVFYGTYIGLTADVEQVREAVITYREFFPRVVGFKLYAGHSVGNLGVIKEEEQRNVFLTLAQEEYDGVLAVHCEKEDLMNSKIWSFRFPITHCFARPPVSEVESVRDILTFAEEHRFRGKLHIAHISVPEAVDIVSQAKEKIDVSCGVCPHHFMFDYWKMFGRDGILYKMNPPLRKPGDNKKMLELLRVGKINWVETDHAPHTLEEKTSRDFMSGITGLQNWNFFVEYLRTNGFGEEQVEKVVHGNVVERFGFEVRKNKRKVVNRRGDYQINYYKLMEEKMDL